eukprot:GHVP01018905.1.p1 GENE.GHVP01018905.1~~GHVP01018905.1.p1  ORF type:complete len:220 (-),score=40.30 GHVP01018905.1:51-710(-)
MINLRLIRSLRDVDPQGAVQLALFVAASANRLHLSEIAYEAFTTAFLCYERHITDTKIQFQSCILMCGSLKASSDSLETDVFSNLAEKIAQYASKLILRLDQCVALCKASYLFHSDTQPDRTDPDIVSEIIQKAITILDNTRIGLGVFESMLEIVEVSYYMSRRIENVIPPFSRVLKWAEGKIGPSTASEAVGVKKRLCLFKEKMDEDAIPNLAKQNSS